MRHSIFLAFGSFVAPISLCCAVVLAIPSSIAAQDISFRAGRSGMVLFMVHPGMERQFQDVMGALRDAIASSNVPTYKQMARSWRLYRSAEPGVPERNGQRSTLFVWVIDPVVPGQNYGVRSIFENVLGKTAAVPLIAQYTMCLGPGGSSLVNLNTIAASPVVGPLAYPSSVLNQGSSAPAIAPAAPTTLESIRNLPSASYASPDGKITVKIEARVTESNSVFSRFSWKATASNAADRDATVQIRVEFQDADGFPVDDSSGDTIRVDAHGEQTATGYALIKADVASRVAKLAGKVTLSR